MTVDNVQAARKKLLSGSGKVESAHDPRCTENGSLWTIPCTPRRKGDSEITPPDSPDSFRLVETPRSWGKTPRYT